MATDPTAAVATPADPSPGIINQDNPFKDVTANAAAYTPGSPPAGTPNAASYKAASYDPASGTASPFTVNRNSTVAGQVEDIIASGSPLMQQAEAKARETMNARGLMNSSMAVSAGESGLIDRALPIASQDAATYATAGRDTTLAKNAMEQFNVGQANAAGQFNAGQDNASQSQRSTQQNSLTQTRMNNESAIQIQQLQNEGNLKNIMAQGVINKELTQIQNENKLQLQNSAGASQLYSQALQAMGAISSDPNLDPAQKQQALNNSATQLSDALKVMSTISGLPDVSKLITFYSQQAAAKVPDAVWPPPQAQQQGGGGFLGMF